MLADNFAWTICQIFVFSCQVFFNFHAPKDGPILVYICMYTVKQLCFQLFLFLRLIKCSKNTHYTMFMYTIIVYRIKSVRKREKGD